MSDSNASASQTAADSRVIAEFLDQVTELLAQRRDADVESLLGRHPEHAERLRQLLPAMRLLANVGCAENAPPAGGSSDSGSGEVAGALGDFRILREIGRGGMGVVYEAEQLSLDRRVALKVLPFASVLDARQLQRFKNEARAAAGLHHTNIVPVYAVGSDRGVHYYAMQYIEGQTLERIIARLAVDGDVFSTLKRDQRGASAGGDVPSPLRDVEYGVENDPEAATAIFPPPGLGAAGHDTPGQGAASEDEGRPQPNGADRVVREDIRPQRHGDTSPFARGSTANGRATPEYFRTVAELGIQAARALDYAHQQGVVHRDVKPSNLIIDDNGNLWITDFGLARMESEQSLTMSGDVLGTLRYMSPEQALARRPLVDHRTDVYSLGATLYELLTLKAAFPETDRRELLRQIADEDPRKPRSLNKSIPAELETIVLKAMEKEPAGRYATAQDLADDLQRFLDHKPIAARPPSLGERSVKWARRHRPIVSAAAVVLVVLGVAGLGALFERSRRQTAADALVNETIDQALVRSGEARAAKDDLQLWSAAVSVMERAIVLANATPTSSDLRQRVARLRRDLQRDEAEARTRAANAACDRKALAAFDVARLEQIAANAPSDDGGIDSERAAAAFGQVFREYGIDLEQLSVEEAAQRMRESAIRHELFVAAFEWSRYTFGAVDSKLRNILAAGAADSPWWEKPLSNALLTQNYPLDQLLAFAQDLMRAGADPTPVAPVCAELGIRGEADTAINLLTECQRRHPGNFWLNVNLAARLGNLGRNDAALPYAMIAVALRPESHIAHFDLGNSLKATGDIDGALAEYRWALALKPEYARAHVNLGNALVRKGELAAGIAELQRALELKPNDVLVLVNFGMALRQNGDLEGAIAQYRRALDLRPDSGFAHYNLGRALTQKGDLKAAIAELRQAVELKELRQAVELKWQDADVYADLGIALFEIGDMDGAIAEYRRGLELKPDHAILHNNLGNALSRNGDMDGAILEYRRAVELQPNVANFHHNLAIDLAEKGELESAMAESRRAAELQPDNAQFHQTLGVLFHHIGDNERALFETRRAVELDPDNAKVHYNLGSFLAHNGEIDAAIAEFRQALELKPGLVRALEELTTLLRDKGDFKESLATLKRSCEAAVANPRLPHPPAQWVKMGERLVELDDLLKGVLAGADRPVTAAETLELAEFAQRFKRFEVSASEFYREAFEKDAGLVADPRNARRYNAACAAALAVTGKGKDAPELSDDEIAAWRQQALEWLRADLAALKELAEKPESTPLVVKMLAHWQKDPDLAGVRDVEVLRQLPEAERRNWEALWSEVEHRLGAGPSASGN
jgi:tetratricopeptide (TPR) repeat protein